MNTSSSLNPREFSKTSLLPEAALIAGAVSKLSADAPTKRIRTSLFGCESVSNQCLPQRAKCPFSGVVS